MQIWFSETLLGDHCQALHGEEPKRLKIHHGAHRNDFPGFWLDGFFTSSGTKLGEYWLQQIKMPVKFEWDLDPGSGELQSCFHLDHVLNTSNGDTEAEFYSNPGISPTLPNDDIWKKFDINDECGFDEELDDLLEDVTWMNPLYASSMTKDAREIRNHDCMWAGHCISEKHDRSNERMERCANLMPLKKPPIKVEETKAVAAATPSENKPALEGNKVCIRKNAVVAPTHARSILLPTRVIAAPASSPTVKTTAPSRFKRSMESGEESPRPETPQSLSDNEDLNFDLPDMKTVEDFAVDTFGYNFVSDIVNNVSSDVTNSDSGSSEFDLYLERMNGEISNVRNCSEFAMKVSGPRITRTNVKQEAPPPVSRQYTTHSFFSDHCYHLSKNARMDNLGVQTPSDSEEEIDVETVYGDIKKPSSRSSSSSGCVLPTNPSFSDREQLQLTMASAISKKDVKRQSARTPAGSPRVSLDDRTLKSKPISCRRKGNARSDTRRTGGSNRRSAQFDDYNDFVSKTLKRKKYQYQRNFKGSKSKKAKNRRSYQRNFGGLSSESDVDSSERRTIHNSMERQRRIDLRNAFEDLRKLVPFTAGNEKAAKVVILSYGAEFCKTLTWEEAELTKKKAELRRQQEMLRARVSQLRRSLAARR